MLDSHHTPYPSRIFNRISLEGTGCHSTPPNLEISFPRILGQKINKSHSLQNSFFSLPIFRKVSAVSIQFFAFSDIGTKRIQENFGVRNNPWNVIIRYVPNFHEIASARQKKTTKRPWTARTSENTEKVEQALDASPCACLPCCNFNICPSFITTNGHERTKCQANFKGRFAYYPNKIQLAQQL